MKVLIFAENASLNMSGEAALALYYFDRLRQRGVEAWLVCHERVRSELAGRYAPDILSRIHFVQDSWAQKALHLGKRFISTHIHDNVVEPIIRLLTQRGARNIIKRLVPDLGIDVVFDPSVISPKSVSCLYGFGVPVVIGPMCGGMTFPPGFRYLEAPHNRFFTAIYHAASQALHAIYPGKLQADALLVANERTRHALPQGCRGEVYSVVESGVDLAIWQPRSRPAPAPGQPVRFVYMARFVEQKGIPYLIEAFSAVASETNAVLELIGSGELLESIKARVRSLGMEHRVNFHGWMALEDAAELIRECDVYVVPAIRDCGGCAMLESMALGLPVIAANWAGPGDYADDKSGLRVDVETRDGFVTGLTQAMLKLARSPELCQQLGEGAKQRVREHYFDWDAKVDRVHEILQSVQKQTRAKPQPRQRLSALL